MKKKLKSNYINNTCTFLSLSFKLTKKITINPKVKLKNKYLKSIGENMKKILTIGGATQDIYLHYEGADYMSITCKDNSKSYMIFESGEKIEVEDILHHTGGGSTNSAISFKRLNFDVSCFCKIGNDRAGKAILNELEKEKVNTKNIATTKKHASGTSFIINSLKRERTIFAHRGSNGFVKNNEIPFDEIKKSNQIYITSLSYNSSKLLPKIVQFTHKNKIPVAINPGKSQLLNGTTILIDSLKHIDTLILNSSEAKQFMIALVKEDKNYQKVFKSKKKTIDKKIDTSSATLLQSPFAYKDFYFSIRNFFKAIIKIGPKTVVVTDGANGVYVATKNKILFHPAIKTEVVDTLGAGDSFGSCFVGCLLHKFKIEKALKAGIINSSSVIQKIGAKPGLLSLKNLEQKLKQFKGNLIQTFDLD